MQYSYIRGGGGVGQSPGEQVCFLLSGPVQLLPAFLGAGQLQLRCTIWLPWPHDAEQGVTSNQSHHRPSTGGVPTERKSKHEN